MDIQKSLNLSFYCDKIYIDIELHLKYNIHRFIMLKRNTEFLYGALAEIVKSATIRLLNKKLHCHKNKSQTCSSGCQVC